MFFGSTTFAQAPFSDIGGGGITVLAQGNRLNIAIGNAIADITVTVNITGQQFNLATNPVSVITWNPIPPGVNQVWVPVDPDA